MAFERLLERRAKPRVHVNFPVILRGLAADGEKFEERGSLDNMSASGLYFWTSRFLNRGDQVFLTVHLSHFETDDGPQDNYLATLGKVVRVEHPQDDTYGVAIHIDDYNFQ